MMEQDKANRKENDGISKIGVYARKKKERKTQDKKCREKENKEERGEERKMKKTKCTGCDE